jgi:hypothetical protein
MTLETSNGDVCFIYVYSFTLPDFLGIITPSFKIDESVGELTHLAHNGDVESSCEHGNEPTGSPKVGISLD